MYIDCPMRRLKERSKDQRLQTHTWSLGFIRGQRAGRNLPIEVLIGQPCHTALMPQAANVATPLVI
jgi:hypothetical protein